MTSAGEGDVIRDVLIIDISDFENRKHEIGRQLYHASHNVGFFYIKGHGVPNKDIDSIFNAGEQFLNLPADVKEKFVWIPDRYLGWRSQSDLESVTGSLIRQLIATFVAATDVHAEGSAIRADSRDCGICAGNKLWEWVSFGRYGTGGYDVRKQARFRLCCAKDSSLRISLPVLHMSLFSVKQF